MICYLRLITLLLFFLSVTFVKAATQPTSVTPCAVPTGFNVYNVTSNRATLYWYPRVPNQPYDLQWRAIGTADWQTVQTVTLTPDTYLLLDLQNNTTYEWRVRLVCAPDQVGAWSAVSTFRTTCPNPTELTVTGIGSSRALVRWLGSTNVTNHILEWRRLGDPAWKREQLTSSGYADFTLQGLTNQTTYEWRVQSVCADLGRSAVVNGLTFTTNCPLPQQLYLESVTPLRTQVRWENYDVGARFDLRWKASNATTWTEVNDLNTTTYTFANLSIGSSYDWQVRRQCPEGSRTAYVSGSTISVVCGAPYLTVTTITPTAAQIEWNPPMDFSGTYNLEWGQQGATPTTIQGLNKTGYTLTNLQPNKAYQVRVGAVCAPGFAGSSTTSFVTTCTAPSISYAPTGPTWIAVHWDIPDQITPHEVQWRSQGTTDWNTVANLPSGIHTLEDLTPGQPYELRVRRLCAPNVYTDYSAIRVVTPGCAPPATASVQVSGTEAEIQWGSGTTGLYELQWRPVGAGSFSTLTGLSTTRYTLTNLQQNTTYEWRLGSVCAPNIPSTSYLTRTFSTSCPSPQNVSASTLGQSGNVTLYWTSGLNVSYRLERQVVGEPDWIIIPNPSTLPTASLTDLMPNKTYRFRVTTLCQNAGESSPVVSNTVALPCPVPSFAFIPRRTATSVWIQSPTGGNTYISGYEVRWRSTYGEPGEWQSLSTTTDGLFYLNDLTGNIPYEYQLRTLCGIAGVSAYGPSQSLSVRCQSPSIYSPTPVSISNGRAAVQWLPQSTGGTVEIQYRGLGELSWATVSTTQPGSYTLTNLTPNTTYEWRIRGLCTDGQWSDYSNPQTISPPNYSLFRHVANMNETILNQTTAKLNWEGRGDGIVSYEVRTRLIQLTDWGEPTLVSGQSLVVSNLQRGASYYWQVRWVDASGERGPWTWEEFFTTVCPTFSISPTYSGAANSLTLMPYNTDTWNEPTVGEIRYRAGFDEWQIAQVSSLTIVLTGLQPNTTYQYQTQRICASGDRSEWVRSSSKTGACQASVGVSVLNPTTVQFNVINNQTLPFWVQIRRSGTSIWEQIDLTTSAYERAGLQPGTVYEWRVVRTCYPPGLTNFAAPLLFVTKCPVAPTPGATARTATSAEIKWPADRGPLTVQWRKSGQTTWQTASDVNSPYVVTGLQPGQFYQFRLRTPCSDGLTDSGISTEVYLQMACPTGDYYATDGRLTSPTAQSVTSNSVRVVWLGAQSGADVSFTLRWRPFGQLAWNETPIATTPYVLTNLTGNTTYEWHIASDCGTNGRASAGGASFTTLPDRSGFYTIMPGDWTDPSIWSGALLPTLSEPVQVRHPVTVQPYQPAQTQKIQYDNGGSLRFKGNAILRIGSL